MDSLPLNAMPGMTEAIAQARTMQNRQRESAMLNLNHDLCGITVRTMTIQDYVSLDRFECPFFYRVEPSVDDLCFFLWVLSPQYAAWSNLVGWRKYFSWLQGIQCRLFGWKVRRKFCRKIPEDSERIVLKCFEYIETMFTDAPPALKAGGESCLAYLTGWFDQIQREYSMPTAEVWQMSLPELFQRLAAIRQREHPEIPVFNRLEDKVKIFVLRGLRAGAFTLEDLAANRVEFPRSIFRN